MTFSWLTIDAAFICFLTHVCLLFTSFPRRGFLKRRYLFSHITLWLTGVFFLLFVLLHKGSGGSSMADVFDTPFKVALILLVPLGLSLVAHLIVKLLVLPALVGDRRSA